MTAVATLWVISIALPAPWKFVVWGVASLVDVAAPVVAGRRRGRAPLHLEHLPERFGLLVILVLGEVIAGIVTGVHDTKWSSVSVLIGVTGFLVAASLWWAYFDVGGAVSARAIQRADGELRRSDDPADPADAGDSADADPATELGTRDEPVNERHDLFVYGHWPLTAGILAVAVGVEELVLHPDRAPVGCQPPRHHGGRRLPHRSGDAASWG
ncbi:MAG: low temperature requirement protein A [Lapillicoccus sp.]